MYTYNIIYIYVCMYLRLNIYIYIHTYIYSIYLYIHIYIYTRCSSPWYRFIQKPSGMEEPRGLANALSALQAEVRGLLCSLSKAAGGWLYFIYNI